MGTGSSTPPTVLTPEQIDAIPDTPLGSLENNTTPALIGDMERLPFRSGAFDKAICLNALHHVPDMRAEQLQPF